MMNQPFLLMAKRFSLFFAACFLLVSRPAFAAERLDDSASPRSRVQSQTVMSDEGRPLADSLNPTRANVNFGRISYKLATAPYVGKQARIYFAIPGLIQGLRSPAGLRVQWRGSQQFASGTARPGERQLVWTGRVTTPWITEDIELSYEVDLRELALPRDGSFGFESYFEIEVFP